MLSSPANTESIIRGLTLDRDDYHFYSANLHYIKYALHQVLCLPNYILSLHDKKRRARCSTGLNNVLLPTLFTLVNDIEQCCWAWIGCNNIVQYCWQLWTMWAAKHCSILFSSVLHQPERFLPCSMYRKLQAMLALKSGDWTEKNFKIDNANGTLKQTPNGTEIDCQAVKARIPGGDVLEMKTHDNLLTV
jgi:hypothetical protein